MKTTLLATALFVFAALPALPQQPSDAAPASPSNPSAQSPESPQQPASTSPSQQASPSQSTATAAAETQPVELHSVTGELVNKLDSKTARPGDDVIIQTSSSVKTLDGTEIPKGSKLTGKVLAVQSSADGKTSQVALNINRAEIKGGQTLPIHSEIQSVGSENERSSAAETMARSAQVPGASAGSSTSPGGAMGAGSSAASSNAPGYAPGYTPGTAGNGGPAAGTIVARNGRIAIRTTSIPGVLLANNAPGEQDPRMTQASGILLGAKKDVQLSSGTKVVLGVASTPATAEASAAQAGAAQAAASK